MTAPVATIDRLGDHVGQTVTLRGWLHNKSSKGKLHFVQLRDGSGYVQCVVFQKNVDPEFFAAVGGLGQESSLSLVGEVVAAGAPFSPRLVISEPSSFPAA
jgi:asparaginyl-tRNA synthetase